MNPETNWLPFVLRETLRIGTNPTTLVGSPTAAELGSFGTGGMDGRVLLQDFSAEFGKLEYEDEEWNWYFSEGLANLDTPITPVMRYGYKHKGYLIDVPIVAGAFHTHGVTIPEAWKFLRPYRIYSGEVMRARYEGIVDSRTEVPSFPRKPGMVFNGIRTVDDQPILMYSSANKLDDGGPILLNQAGFTCPGDSPVDIWGVSAFGVSDLELPGGPKWQITGPDERDWYKHRIRNNLLNLAGTPIVPPAGVLDARWITHRWERVELGEGKGWMMERDETFIIEVGVDTALKGTDSEVYIAMITLRGFMEVNHG